MLQLIDPLDQLGHTDVLLVFIAKNSSHEDSSIQLEELHDVANGLIV